VDGKYRGNQCALPFAFGRSPQQIKQKNDIEDMQKEIHEVMSRWVQSKHLNIKHPG